MFDRDFTTKGEEEVNISHVVHVMVTPECCGKYISVYIGGRYPDYVYVNFYDASGNRISGRFMFESYSFGSNYGDLPESWPSTSSVIIPTGTVKIQIASGSSGLNLDVYEVWVSDENLSRHSYTNDNKPF